MTAEDAERIGAVCAERAEEIFGMNLFSEEVPVQRVLCTSSKNYKGFRRKNRDWFAEILLGQPLPHFIWLIEYSASSQRAERKAVIEIALDATAAPFEKRPFLWIRYPGRAMMNWGRVQGDATSFNGTELPEAVGILEIEESEKEFAAFPGNLTPIC